MKTIFAIASLLFSLSCWAQVEAALNFFPAACEARKSELSSVESAHVLASPFVHPDDYSESLWAADWNGIRIPFPADLPFVRRDSDEHTLEIEFGQSEVLYKLSAIPSSGSPEDEAANWSKLGIRSSPMSSWERLKLGFRITPDSVDCYSHDVARSVNQILALTMKVALTSRFVDVYFLEVDAILLLQKGRTKLWHYLIPTITGEVESLIIAAKEESHHSGIGNYVGSRYLRVDSLPVELLSILREARRLFDDGKE